MVLRVCYGFFILCKTTQFLKTVLKIFLVNVRYLSSKYFVSSYYTTIAFLKLHAIFFAWGFCITKSKGNVLRSGSKKLQQFPFENQGIICDMLTQKWTFKLSFLRIATVYTVL
jgi:hypothetical protein